MVNQAIKKRALHRAKIIAGQVNGLMKAIEREDYCVDLLTQSFSIQNSLKSLNAFLLENHLVTHVVHQMRKRSEEKKARKELIKIYTLSHK
ncbi:metal-sensitive transcriptional regulator [Candidatus Peregrinibacteria bacterium]|nr:metal-sensitive transcriptional regulator [Candidatus Peregrinibacteria bacterium]